MAGELTRRRFPEKQKKGAGKWGQALTGRLRAQAGGRQLRSQSPFFRVLLKKTALGAKGFAGTPCHCWTRLLRYSPSREASENTSYEAHGQQCHTTTVDLPVAPTTANNSCKSRRARGSITAGQAGPPQAGELHQGSTLPRPPVARFSNSRPVRNFPAVNRRRSGRRGGR